MVHANHDHRKLAEGVITTNRVSALNFHTRISRSPNVPDSQKPDSSTLSKADERRQEKVSTGRRARLFQSAFVSYNIYSEE
jgi:hypothetical protein